MRVKYNVKSLTQGLKNSCIPRLLTKGCLPFTLKMFILTTKSYLLQGFVEPLFLDMIILRRIILNLIY
jgi:hypothetical protein